MNRPGRPARRPSRLGRSGVWARPTRTAARPAGIVRPGTPPATRPTRATAGPGWRRRPRRGLPESRRRPSASAGTRPAPIRLRRRRRRPAAPASGPADPARRGCAGFVAARCSAGWRRRTGPVPPRAAAGPGRARRGRRPPVRCASAGAAGSVRRAAGGYRPGCRPPPPPDDAAVRRSGSSRCPARRSGWCTWTCPPVTSGLAIGSLIAGIASILVSLLVICFGVAGARLRRGLGGGRVHRARRAGRRRRRWWPGCSARRQIRRAGAAAGGAVHRAGPGHGRDQLRRAVGLVSLGPGLALLIAWRLLRCERARDRRSARGRRAAAPGQPVHSESVGARHGRTGSTDGRPPGM